jgi:hypothetical protein
MCLRLLRTKLQAKGTMHPLLDKCEVNQIYQSSNKNWLRSTKIEPDP